MVKGIQGKAPWLVLLLFVFLLIFPLVLTRFYVYLVALILVTGLLATSLNIVLGYGGIYQFHHAVFYGVGAYTAGMYHLLTHGAFKALLFLGCGSVIIALHHEQDMRRMGGLKDKLPVTYWTFVVGSLDSGNLCIGPH